MKSAVNVIYTMSNDEKIREAARMREKRLHDEASLLYGAREEGREEGLKEGRAEGGLQMLYGLVSNGLISASQAAGQAKLSEKEFVEAMIKAGFSMAS